MSLSQDFPEAKKLSLVLQQQLTKLEGGDDSADLQTSIRTNLTRLTQDIMALENLVSREYGDRKESWARRVSAISEECGSVRVAFEKFVKHHQRVLSEDVARQQLLGSRFGESRNRLIDSYASEHDVLRKSQREVREMNTIANNVVQAMREQREKFKSTRRKMWDVASSLGMSGSLMRLIQRREFTDSLFVYGGMTVSVIILILLYYFFVIRKAVGE